MMKILLVNDFATPGYGAENLVLVLREGLRRKGYDARLFASSAKTVGGQNVLADYQCFGTLTRLNTLLQTANPWAFWHFRRVLTEFQPDVVHVMMHLTQLSPLILPLLKKVPSIYHAVNYRPICPMGTKMLPNGTICRVSAGKACYQNKCLPLHSLLPQMLELWLWRRWHTNFNLTITISDNANRHLMVEGIKPDKVLWPPISVRPPRPPLAPPPTVAFAGRLVREKGADVLVHAFAKTLAKIPDTRLIIAGGGPEQKHLERLTAYYGLDHHVIMTGHLLRHEMERLFETAWIQAVPGLFDEPFGMVAAEAMMRGTAVVASSVGGPAEFIQQGWTGLLVPPGNENALAEALIYLLKDRELSDQIGKAGRKFAFAHFDREIYLNRIIQLYQKICFDRKKSN